MGTCDLSDTVCMYAFSPWAYGSWALGLHIKQIPCAHVTTTITSTFKYYV